MKTLEQQCKEDMDFAITHVSDQSMDLVKQAYLKAIECMVEKIEEESNIDGTWGSASLSNTLVSHLKKQKELIEKL